jgi:hypothetical protein
MSAALEQLVGMGFEREAAANALQLCDDDLEQSISLLADGAASPTAPAPAPAPAPVAAPAVAPAPLTPRLSRSERLEADITAMAALVSDPSSAYHRLLAPVWSWDAPQLRLCTAAGEPCTLTFDAEEYPQGAEWTDHPAFAGSLPPFGANAAAKTTRVRQLVDLIIRPDAPKVGAGGTGGGSGSEDEDAAETGSEEGDDLSLASDDELFGSSGDNSEFSEESSDDDYANFRTRDTGSPSPRPGSARSMHAHLRRDVELVQRIFGPGAASISDATFEEKVVVELTLDFTSGILGRDTMIAWSLPPQHPFITIRMQLDRHLYTETRSVPEEGRPINPYFHVFNRDRMEGVPKLDKDGKPSHDLGKKGIPVCIQLCHAVLGPQSGFVKRWWDAWVASKGSSQVADGSDDASEILDPITGWPVLQTARNCLTGRPFRKDAAGNGVGTTRTVLAPVAGDEDQDDEEAASLERAISASLADHGGAEDDWVDPSWAEPDEAKVVALAGVLGVEPASANYHAVSGALALCDNDPDDALNKFFDDADACIAVGQMLVDRALCGAVLDAEGQLEPEPEPDAGEDLSRQASSASSNGSSAGRKLVRQPSAEREAEALREADIPEGCFLLDLLCYLKLRLPTLNRYCVVSDKPHVFEPMLIPTVSSRPDAMFTFENYDGWWNLAAKDVASQAEVVDLLVHMAHSIFHSSRWDTLLGIGDGPNYVHRDALFPTLTLDGKQVVSPKIGSACIGRIRTVLASICDIGVSRICEDSGKSHLEAIDPIGWKLFQWVIHSNRTFLVRLPLEKQIKALSESGVNCVHQFLMKSAAPEKEAKFRALKAKHKTVFAFHGSRMECWHAIVRAGLKNVSGTAMMTAGQAHGAGTYTSPDMGTSMGYSQIQMRGGGDGKAAAGGHRDFLVAPVFCMAICEIIDTGSSIKRSGSIWVVPDNDHINTRFLLVWDAGNMPRGATASTVQMDQELRAATEQGADIVDVGA